MPGAKKFYFYQVHSNPNRDLPHDDCSQLLTRYFRTADQVADYVGCGRATVFNVIRGRYDRSISTNGYIIEKCNPPIRSVKMVEVENAIIS